MIYLIILGVMFVFAFFDICDEEHFPKYRYIFLALFFIFLLAFAGLRYKVGYDYDSYKSIFDTVTMKNFMSLYIEVGYTGLNAVLKTLGFGFEAVIFVVAAWSLFFKYEAIRKYSIYPFVSLILYFSSNFIIQDFGQIRQGLAIAMTLYSIGSIKERNLIKFLVLMGIAMSFHYTAVLFVPLYFLGNIKLSYKQMLAIVAASIMFYVMILMGVFEYFITHVLHSEYILWKYQYYSGEPLGFFDFTFIFRVFVFAAFVYLGDKIKPVCKYYDILRNGYFIAIIMYIVFNTNEGLATRGALYYKTFEIILVPYIIYAVKNKLFVFNAALIFYFYTVKDVLGAILWQTEKFLPYNNVLFEFFKHLK